VGTQAHRTAQEERDFPAEEIRDRARRHLEEKDGDQIDGEDAVDLEEVEAPAEEKQRVDGGDEEAGEGIAAGDQVVGALASGHDGTCGAIVPHSRRAGPGSNYSPPHSSKRNGIVGSDRFAPECYAAV